VWLARAITEAPAVLLHRRSAAVEETHRHHPAAAEVAVDTVQLLCPLHNVAHANKDPPDLPDRPETRVVQAKTAVMVKTEATAKMERLEKRTVAAPMDMQMETEAQSRHHLAKSVHLVLLVQPAPLVRKVRPVRRELPAVPLQMANEAKEVKSAPKDHLDDQEIQVPKDPMAMQARLIQSKAQPVPQAHQAKMVPKVQLVHLVKTVNPARPAVAVEKAKMVTPVVPENLAPQEVQAERAPPGPLDHAIIAQRLVRLPAIRTEHLETIDTTHDNKIYALFLFMVLWNWRISTVDF